MSLKIGGLGTNITAEDECEIEARLRDKIAVDVAEGDGPQVALGGRRAFARGRDDADEASPRVDHGSSRGAALRLDNSSQRHEVHRFCIEREQVLYRRDRRGGVEVELRRDTADELRRIACNQDKVAQKADSLAGVHG